MPEVTMNMVGFIFLLVGLALEIFLKETNRKEPSYQRKDDSRDVCTNG